MLKYTGHPLVDVGAATIAAFARKRNLAALTEEDLDAIGDFIIDHYTVNPLKSFLTVAFPNSGFTNPNPVYELEPEKRIDYAKKVVRAFKSEVPRLPVRCVFTGVPAVAYAYRQHIPMTTGEEVFNFHPGGMPGLPVSGKALLCVQAFPLGCGKCAGKLLAVHSDDYDLTYEFASEFLAENRAALSLVQASGSSKMPEAKMAARTLLVDTLLKAESRRKRTEKEQGYCSVTAYLLTNSGKSSALGSNPPLEIFHLPMEITSFLREVGSPNYSSEWQALARRAWRLQVTGKAKKGKVKESGDDSRPRRNVLYEDLFRLPGDAARFVRTYFLRLPWQRAREDDPRRTYSLRNETDLVSWRLTELFLRRVMCVEGTQIKQIRELGDRLADYVASQNDQKFFRAFFMASKYYLFRNVLLKADMTCLRRGNAPLVTFDQYVEVFEEGEEVERPDWELARDLTLIRMIERLHEIGWISANKEAIPDVAFDELADKTAVQ